MISIIYLCFYSIKNKLYTIYHFDNNKIPSQSIIQTEIAERAWTIILLQVFGVFKFRGFYISTINTI